MRGAPAFAWKSRGPRIETGVNVERIIHHIMEKKGDDIVVLDLRKINAIADYFIIAAGSSNVQVKAIADEVKEKMAKNYPLRRLGTADEVANAVVFLASDAASWITGQAISVDGGYSTA